MFLNGLLFSLGAICCWGTALIFLKVRKVKDAGISPVVMTMFYSIGYLLTALLTAAVTHLTNVSPVHITIEGVLGGVLWGIGKLCTILAVTSPIGIAMGQSIQCCCNIVATFGSGLLTGESTWWPQFLGVCILMVGIAVVASPGMACTKSRLALVDPVPDVCSSQDSSELAHPSDRMTLSEHRHSVQAVQKSTGGISILLGAWLAAISGLFMGLQALPFKLGADQDSLSYAVSEALGQFLTILTLFSGARLWGLAEGFRAGVPIGLLAGLAGGGLLFAAALCNTYAVQEIGLVGSCLSQLNMVVAGTWGIGLFHEITDRRLIVVFFSGTAIAISGASLLEWAPN